MTRAEDVAWAAGLFEGEGSIVLQHKKTANGNVWDYANLRLGMTDEDVVQMFRNIVGVGSVSPPRHRPPYKDMYYWSCNGRNNFKVVADLLRPFLGKRRLARLEEVESAASPVRRNPPRRDLCSRGHWLVGGNAKPNGSSKNGRPKVACRACINARYKKALMVNKR